MLNSDYSKPRYVLYQAYGNEGVLTECKLAMLSLWAHNNTTPVTLVLYTDEPDYFLAELKLFEHKIIEVITPDKVAAWRGAINFVHRVKIKVLQDFFSKHQGSVLYCDTDTFCTQPLNNLFEIIEQGCVVMHLNEGLVCKPTNILSDKLYRYLRKNRDVLNIEPAQTASIEMWNAGVIGLSSVRKNLLTDVLELTDALYKGFPKHIAEQFAFSFVLQQQAPIKSAASSIFHYWNLKEYRQLLAHLFSTFSTHKATEFVTIKTNLWPQQILSDKLQFKSLSFFRKMFCKKWRIENYF